MLRRPSRPGPSAGVPLVGMILAAALHGPVFALPDFPGYEYISPRPGSRLVMPQNNIAVRSGRPVNDGQLQQVSFLVEGRVSGVHAGTLEVSDDHETVIFTPAEPFAPGEEVLVTIEARAGGGSVPPLDPAVFNFFVTPGIPPAQAAALRRAAIEDGTIPESDDPGLRTLAGVPAPALLGGDALTDLALPPGFPDLFVPVNDGNASGHTFLAPFQRLTVDPGYLMVLDELRNPVFYRKLVSGATDFKPQPNGLMTYWTVRTPFSDVPRYYAMDASGAIVDSIEAGNGYEIDLHELQVLENGHLLLMIYDPQPVRMDSVVPGGRPDAVVIGLVIQELDLRRRVVFQWRSWEDFAFTDLVDQIVRLTSPSVDFAHGNSIERDRDGHLVISSRHMNEVTKINRRTADVLWRMGANAVNNQFTIENDPRGWSHMHDVRRLPNGNMTMFDNGNFIAPARSRAAEYEMDEENRVARLVWEYRHTPDLFGSFLGSVQRLPDGGTLIGWGGTGTNLKFTEVRADGSVAWDGGFVPINFNCYRVLRGPWRTTRIEADPEILAFGSNAAKSAAVRTVRIRNPGPGPLDLNSFSVAGDPAFRIAAAEPRVLAVGETAEISVAFEPEAPGRYLGKLYAGTTSPEEILLQEVVLRGHVGPVRDLRGDGPAADRTSARVTSIAMRPGSTAATIRYALAEDADVEIAIYGVQGRRLATISRGFQPAGDHGVVWDARNAPSGVYFCRLTAGSRTETRKFAVTR